MDQKDMYTLVPQKLREIEKEYGIRVLYAAESGSRAWGTCLEDSDFDIRFIYIRPLESYLKLEEEKDVLEFPISEGWDMCGWDIRKLLKLLHHANSQIYEWFASPVVYVDEGFSQRIRPLLEGYFSVKTTCYHYLHQGDLKRKKAIHSPQPKVKHYLYILQHLSCTRWVLTRGEPVPVDYRAVTALLEDAPRKAAEEILARKLAGERFIDPEPWLDAWIEAERARLSEAVARLPQEEKPDWEPLDQFFLSESGDGSAG